MIIVNIQPTYRGSQFDNAIVDHDFFVGAQNELRKCLESFGKTREPRCIPILGPSGSGKSTVVQKFAEEHIPTVSRSGYDRPILIVETPSNPSAKTMASEVLREQGDPLYFRGTEVQMTTRIVDLLKAQNTRLIVFDEMQSLIDRDSTKLNHKVADWLKRLLNKARVPTVIVGLEQTEKLFQANEQLRRRFREAFIMSPFEWKDREKRKILRGFLATIQDQLVLADGLDLSSPEMAYRFFCASNGLVGYIMAILREANELSHDFHEPKITVEILATAYADVVCGNKNVQINPFVDISDRDLDIALHAVEPSIVTRKGN